MVTKQRNVTQFLCSLCSNTPGETKVENATVLYWSIGRTYEGSISLGEYT